MIAELLKDLAEMIEKAKGLDTPDEEALLDAVASAFNQRLFDARNEISRPAQEKRSQYVAELAKVIAP